MISSWVASKLSENHHHFILFFWLLFHLFLSFLFCDFDDLIFRIKTKFWAILRLQYSAMWWVRREVCHFELQLQALNSGFCSTKRHGVLLLLLDRILGYSPEFFEAAPQFTGAYLCTWEERCTKRTQRKRTRHSGSIKRAQRSAASPARAWSRAAPSWDHTADH